MFIPLTRDFFQHAMLVSRIWRVIKSKIPGPYKINHYPFPASKLFASQKDFRGVKFWWTFYLKVKIDGLRIPILVDE